MEIVVVVCGKNCGNMCSKMCGKIEKLSNWNKNWCDNIDTPIMIVVSGRHLW